jgi:hypothetical protein
MKQLEEATAEAVKYHDKYLAAMEKVMTCLLNSSDTWRDIRTHLGQGGTTAMDDVAPSGGRLAASYNTWKVSKEMQMLRDQLMTLQDLSKAGRQQTKKAKSDVEELEKAAKKCAEVNSADNEAKIAQRSGSAREKLLKEKKAQNERVGSLDRTVMNSMQSIGTWWCATLVSQCDELYHGFTQLGHRTLACFATSAPQQPDRQQVSVVSSNAFTHGQGTTATINTSFPTGLAMGVGHTRSATSAWPHNTAAATASGVPVKFDSYPRNVNVL